MHRAIRIVAATAFLALIVIPLCLPYLSLVRNSEALAVWTEVSRISELFSNSATLIGLTLLFTMPLGITAACGLARANNTSATMAHVLFVLALAIPLPVTTVAWHTLRVGPWSPFAQGLWPAVMLHTIAGIPWVVLIIFVGLKSRDPYSYDDAVLHADSLTCFLRVTLPAVGPFIILAALCVAVHTGTEIVMTDMVQFRTFAEEVYTQIVAPATDSKFSGDIAVARAVAATIPWPLLTVVVFAWILRRFHRQPSSELHSVRPNSLGIIAVVLAVLLTAAPTIDLIIRCGQTASGFTLNRLPEVIAAVVKENAAIIASSLAAAAAAGVIVSVFVGASLLHFQHQRGNWLLLFAAFASAVPGPIIGLGIRSAINGLLIVEELAGISLLRGPLYDGPSLLPVTWAWVIRAWPLAVAVWLPAIARLPRSFGESTRLDSASIWQLLKHEIWPALWQPFAMAAGLVTIFALGEVSASRIVATPGGQSFAHDVFARMHYGITPELAGMCLVLLGVVTTFVITGTTFILRRAAR